MMKTELGIEPEKKVEGRLKKDTFGTDFEWGVATSAYQIEGGWDRGGRGLSIWDTFCREKGRILNGQTGNEACDHYNRWKSDLKLMADMGITNYRFSISWSRVYPKGKGWINHDGIDFYQRLIDDCLGHGITPWITLYHWDLPQSLEKRGGWTNRKIINWFSNYVETCALRFGDRVKNWMVLNEPMVFTGAGYFLGLHAPGRKGLKNFIPAVHHAAICQAQGGKIIKDLVSESNVGTTFSCSHVDPFRSNSRDLIAAKKVDALLNRLFLEPALGLGYPIEDLKPLRRIEKYMKAEDESNLSFEFDFIGIQNYTREVVKHSFFTPFINATLVNADKRNVPMTTMNWEVYPESIYRILKKFGKYPGIKKIVITENGSAFPDVVENGKIHDKERKHYLKSHLYQVLRAKKEGVPIDGYFVWSFLDNFEWSEGFLPRFGIVYVDYQSQKRIIKDSGAWYSEFLKNS